VQRNLARSVGIGSEIYSNHTHRAKVLLVIDGELIRRQGEK
jgi:hypothetical protein